ncbi:MAG: nucleotidyltransferase domain-containing protein [Candidatus Aminicenantes bacterium]|jgi:predicted nucleotidyltransferase
MKNISVIRNKLTLKILEDIKREITASLGNDVKEIVLYGSYARSEETRDSDIDIVVLLNDKISNKSYIREKLADIKVDLSLKYDIVISILIKDYHQYVRLREVVPFYSALYNEGIEFHG